MDNGVDRVKAHAQAYRSSRDAVLRGVGRFLVASGFTKKSNTAYFRPVGMTKECIAFQKLSSGKTLRLIASYHANGRDIPGPLSDPYAMRQVDGSRPYNFRYHFTDDSIDRCIAEFERFISNEVTPWFSAQHANLALVSGL